MLVADVDADGWTVEDQDLGIGRQPLRQHDALLIAAGQGLDRRVDVGRSDAKPRDPIAGQLAPATGRNESEGVGQSVQDRDRHVIGDGLLKIEAERQSILRNVGDPSFHGVLVRAKIERSPIDQDFAAVERATSRKSASASSVRPAPSSPIRLENLATTKDEGHVLEFARA